jgi:hypothetical protein
MVDVLECGRNLDGAGRSCRVHVHLVSCQTDELLIAKDPILLVLQDAVLPLFESPSVSGMSWELRKALTNRGQLISILINSHPSSDSMSVTLTLSSQLFAIALEGSSQASSLGFGRRLGLS